VDGDETVFLMGRWGRGVPGGELLFRYTLIKVYFEGWIKCLRVGGGVRWELRKREASDPHVGEGS